MFQEVVVAFIDLVKKDKFRGESTVKTFLVSLNRYYNKKQGRQEAVSDNIASIKNIDNYGELSLFVSCKQAFSFYKCVK